MQDLVGIVRNEDEMQEALTRLDALQRARRARRRRRPSRVQPRLAHVPRPAQPARRSPRRSRARRSSARRAAAATSARTIPDKVAEFGTFNIVVAAAPDGAMQVVARADSADAGRAEAGHRGAEAVMAQATFRIWRGEPGGGRASSRTTRPRSPRAWSCSTPCTRSRPSRRPTWPCRWNCKAGKCGSCSAEINGKPRLMCMTRLNTLDLTEPVTVEPMRAFPLDQGPGHRRVVELPGQEEHQDVQAAPARCRRRHLAHGAARRRPRAGIPQVHRVLPVPGRLPRAARPRQARRVHRPALLRLRRGARDAPARHRRPAAAI